MHASLVLRVGGVQCSPSQLALPGIPAAEVDVSAGATGARGGRQPCGEQKERGRATEHSSGCGWTDSREQREKEVQAKREARLIAFHFLVACFLIFFYFFLSLLHSMRHHAKSTRVSRRLVCVCMRRLFLGSLRGNGVLHLARWMQEECLDRVLVE